MVNVSNKQNSAVIKVTSSNGNTIVTAKADSAQFWSNQSKDSAQESKNWANKLGDAVDGIEYSAKHYANLANSYVEGFEDVVNSNTNDIIATSNDYMNQIIETANESISNVENILKDIEFVAEGEKEEIQELVDKAKDDIESTGFYMRDDKLYFINSKGEEEEFKSGGLNDKITNCLLEVPQRIKYELNEGTLTIKAGSVVIIPYGTEDLTGNHPVGSRFLNDTFKVYDTQFDDGKFFVWAELVNDCSTDYIPNGNYSVQLTLGKSVWRTKELNFDYAGTNNIFSGANVPTTTATNSLWYDTTNNVIKTSGDKGVTWEVTNNTFPFANANLTANVGVSSVSQVFNGFGYIGSTVWVDKGVKALLPNGINEEGGLNNIEITSQKVSIVTNASLYQPILYVFNGFGEVSTSITYYWIYDEVSNHYMHNNDIGHFVILAQSDTTNGVISNFQPKQPVRLVKDEEFKELEKVALKTNQITNCITEIPQRIKYTLENGTLTIKAGSVVIVPYGTEDLTAEYPKGSIILTNRFKVIDTQYIDGKFFVWAETQDDNIVAYGSVGDDLCLCLANTGSSILTALKNVTSGATEPTSTIGRRFWYDTENNYVKNYAPNATTFNYNTLPIALVNCTEANKFEVNQVFNGMGYIGSTVWIDKGVKALISNGRNEDGTLNNIEAQNNALDTITYTNDIKGVHFGFSRYGDPELNGAYSYDEKDNYVYNGENKVPVIYCGTYDVVGGKVANFQPKQPFRAVDYNDISNLTMGMPDYSCGATLTLTTGTIFNVPYDCMIYLRAVGNSAGEIVLKLDNVNGAEILRFGSATVAAVPVVTFYFAKDTKIYVSSLGNLNVSLIYPLKGVK